MINLLLDGATRVYEFQRYKKRPASIGMRVF